MKKRVTGIGGIFFRCKDPVGVRNWYATHLGLATNDYGSMFEFRNMHEPKKVNTLQWTTFSENTKYFDPSEKQFMINYRVENLVELVKQLKEEGVTVCDEIEEFEYGKFVHVMDPEGNKIELWEPIDGPLIDHCAGNATS